MNDVLKQIQRCKISFSYVFGVFFMHLLSVSYPLVLLVVPLTRKNTGNKALNINIQINFGENLVIFMSYVFFLSLTSGLLISL